MQWLLVQRGSWLEKLRLSSGRMTRLKTVRYALRTTLLNARFLSCALAPDSRPPPPARTQMREPDADPWCNHLISRILLVVLLQPAGPHSLQVCQCLML